MIWLMNMGFAGGGAVVVPEPEADKGKDAGSGWWEGEWIIPGVTHYLPEKPPEDITPLRPKVEEIKQRARKLPAAHVPEIASIRGRIGALSAATARLERQAVEIAVLEQEAERDRLIRMAVNRYREVEARRAAIEAVIEGVEGRIRARIMEEDDRFIQMLMEME